MTVNTTNITSGPYTGNGVTTQFSYTFRVEGKSQLKVYETTDAGVQTLLTVDTDYTVAGIGDDGGGTITRVAGALPSNYKWYVRSDYSTTQLTDFDSQGGFFPDVHESAIDKITFLIQQLEDQAGRSVRIALSDPDGAINEMEELTSNSFIRVNSAATGFEMYSAGTTPVTAEIPLVDYDEFRNGTADFDIDDYSDGQIIWITTEGKDGAFKIKTGATPADNSGTVIRSTVDTNRYAQRLDTYVVYAENFDSTSDAMDAGDASEVLQVNLQNGSVGSGKLEIPTAYSMRMKGLGSAQTILSFTHTDDTQCIHQGSGGSDRFIRYFENFKVQGGANTGHGFHFESPAIGPQLTDIWVRDCSGSDKAAVKLENCFIGRMDDLKVFSSDIGIDMVRAKGIISRNMWNADNDVGIRMDEDCNGNRMHITELGLATLDDTKVALDLSGRSNKLEIDFYENYNNPRAIDFGPKSFCNQLDLLNSSTLSIWDDGCFNSYAASGNTQFLNLISGFGFAGNTIVAGNPIENRYNDSSWKDGATTLGWNPFGATAPTRSHETTIGYLDDNSLKLDWGTTALSGVESGQSWLVNDDDIVSVMMMVRSDRDLEATEQLVFKVHGAANENRKVEYVSDLRAGEWRPVLMVFKSDNTEEVTLNITLDADSTHTALVTYIDDVVFQINKKTIGLLQNDTTRKTITAITQANPAVITSTAHGLMTGNKVVINGVVGMTEINSQTIRTITVIDANSFSLNSLDSSAYTAYTSGGTAELVKIFSKNSGALIPKVTFGQASIDVADNMAAVPGILFTSTATQATTGTSEEVLVTHRIPANALWKDGMGIRIKAWGVTASNGNTKQLRIRFGGLTGTIVADTGSPGANNKTWTIEATIIRTGGATQIYMGEAISNDSVRPPVSGNDSEDLSTETDLVVTGLTASGAGDATYSGSIVEIISKV